MKILLLGEYSAFHKNLKEGLQVLGHSVVLAGSSDGFKKIPVDLSFDSGLPRPFGPLHRIVNHFAALPKLRGFDVVQAINPFILHRFAPVKSFFRRVARQNASFYLVAAGDDAYYWQKARFRLRYGPFDDCLTYDLKSPRSIYSGRRALAINDSVLEDASGVIPVMYDYEVGYRDHPKRLKTIPLPMNIDAVKWRENRVQDRLVVMHGLNRYGYKGTRHVEAAFEILRKKYPADLDLVIAGGMPLPAYLELMDRTNVVIDQTSSYSLGMNGVYAMAMGKVVIGGAEPESLQSLGVQSSPVINVLPSADSVVQAVERVLEARHRLADWGVESREMAERVHGHVRVATSYLQAWQGGSLVGP